MLSSFLPHVLRHQFDIRLGPRLVDDDIAPAAPVFALHNLEHGRDWRKIVKSRIILMITVYNDAHRGRQGRVVDGGGDLQRIATVKAEPCDLEGQDLRRRGRSRGLAFLPSAFTALLALRAALLLAALLSRLLRLRVRLPPRGHRRLVQHRRRVPLELAILDQPPPRTRGRPSPLVNSQDPRELASSLGAGGSLGTGRGVLLQQADKDAAGSAGCLGAGGGRERSVRWVVKRLWSGLWDAASNEEKCRLP